MARKFTVEDPSHFDSQIDQEELTVQGASNSLSPRAMPA